MVEDYTVKITYKNKSLETISQREVSLVDYCKEQRQNLMHIIADVESAFYLLQPNKNKDEWSAETMEAFQKIRHKVLDSANNVERLPKNIYYKNCNISAIDATEYVGAIINAATKEK